MRGSAQRRIPRSHRARSGVYSPKARFAIEPDVHFLMAQAYGDIVALALDLPTANRKATSISLKPRQLEAERSSSFASPLIPRATRLAPRGVARRVAPYRRIPTKQNTLYCVYD